MPERASDSGARKKMHAGEVDIDEELVERLLAAQFPPAGRPTNQCGSVDRDGKRDLPAWRPTLRTIATRGVLGQGSGERGDLVAEARSVSVAAYPRAACNGPGDERLPLPVGDLPLD